MSTTTESALKAGFELVIVDVTNLARGQGIRLGHNGRLRTPRPIRSRHAQLDEALAARREWQALAAACGDRIATAVRPLHRD